jgi:hypothetical protein
MWSIVLSTHQFVEISYDCRELAVWKTQTQVPSEGQKELGIAYNNHILYIFPQAGD